METLSSIQLSSQELITKISDWVNALILQLPNLVIAIIVLTIGIFSLSFIKKGAQKLVSKTTNNPTIVNLAVNVSGVLFMVIIGLMILSIFNLDGAVNKFLATAGVLGLAIGLALQDPLQNLFSGVLMSVRTLYNINDIVETNGHFGTIKNISLRSTILSTPQGQRVTIPNKDVITKPLINYSYLRSQRLDLNCGVSYAEDLEKVKSLTIHSVKDLPNIDSTRPVKLYYDEFAGSSINYTLQIWTLYRSQADYNEFKSNAIMSIKKAYDKAGISIPFPIRTVDFGIKGGIALNEMLEK